MLKLGYAQADITPEEPLELVGFNRADNLSKGVESSLLAQVSVWEGEERCCLIAVDSLGFMKNMTDLLRERVCKVLGVSKDKVMVCFSHTHAAPNADSEKQYFEMICDKVSAAAVRAMADLKTVSVGYGNAEVDIGVNRRAGGIKVDERAGFLLAQDEKTQKNCLLLVRLTAHGNVLKADNYRISPDYFGAVREVLQEQYDCPVMVLQGASGNIAPKYFDSETTPVDARGPAFIRSKDALHKMAEEVREKLAERIARITFTADTTMRMYSKEMMLYAEVPSSSVAEKIASEAKELCGIGGTEWLAEVSRLRESGVCRQEEGAEVQYFSVGNWCLCGVPYELMTEFALGGVERTGNEFFYINGYTNGCLSYFPMEEEFDKGGYEVYWSMLIYYKYFHRVFPFERESGEKLLYFMVENAFKDC
ncbi:MAG: alkaline ceramidase [Lachnospiraceae bacterium]|nr:alkaline ceramidase [Lachnospiraceae bacterium]